ncbi:hypothetical protein OPT61_g9217 [Boeremia exigua]|uniref:Uncharacterized protein n=1 Tax=Boeremia exigua TaxID=749465 RepID=A0ACC2HV31_9PLEO|nr:hypothetical protein OPT61_g9217 [Boeremia exigua]
MKLGVDYVWIDALCIVQDDQVEWAEEAAKMAEVYSGAYVVIAATRASSVKEGFLQHHTAPLELAALPQTRRSWTVQAQRLDPHNFDDNLQFNNLPLSQRGWFGSVSTDSKQSTAVDRSSTAATGSIQRGDESPATNITGPETSTRRTWHAPPPPPRTRRPYSTLRLLYCVDAARFCVAIARDRLLCGVSSSAYD